MSALMDAIKKQIPTFSMKGLLLAVFVCAILSWAFSYLYHVSSLASSSACCGRCHQLGRAIALYHLNNGYYPPAYLTDESGQPMHSWRAVLLDDYFGGNNWNGYRYEEPWNSTHNQQFVRQEFTRENYQCAVQRRWSWGAFTNYVLITGPGTVFPGAEKLSVDDIADGPENTIMAVHVCGTDYQWMEPRDLTLAEIDAAIANGQPLPIQGCHPDGWIHVVLANGECQILSPSIPPKVFRGLLTIDGGEGITQKQLVDEGYFDYEYKSGERYFGDQQN